MPTICYSKRILSSTVLKSLINTTNLFIRELGADFFSFQVKIYPPPGLLVAKNSARKLLARLRALQDAIGKLTLIFTVEEQCTMIQK